MYLIPQSPYGNSGVSFKTIAAIVLLSVIIGVLISNRGILDPQQAAIEQQRKAIELKRYQNQVEIEQERAQRQLEEDIAFRHELHQLMLDILTLLGIALGIGIAAGSTFGIVLATRAVLSRSPPRYYEGYRAGDIVPYSAEPSHWYTGDRVSVHKREVVP